MQPKILRGFVILVKAALFFAVNTLLSRVWGRRCELATASLTRRLKKVFRFEFVVGREPAMLVASATCLRLVP